MTLTTPYQWCKQGDLLSKIFLVNICDDLFLAPFYHSLFCIVRIGFTDARKQETKEIIYLRNGSHSGTWIFIRCFLFDGYYRRQPGNLIYIRPFHITDELAGVSTEGFHIAALSFRINGIK